MSDPVTTQECVNVHCPMCFGGASEMLYPRPDRMTFFCGACGFEDDIERRGGVLVFKTSGQPAEPSPDSAERTTV